MITNSQRQILEAVLEALPSKLTNTGSDIDWVQIGYNRAVNDVRVIINEFLEPPEKLWRNKNNGTIYRNVDLNGSGIALVTNQKGSTYLVDEKNLEEIQNG